MGDLTSLLDVLKNTKPLQRFRKWSYSQREAIKLRTRLEDTVHESIKRAQQHELDGCWREAEYLWRSIKMYASSDRPKEIRNARMEAKFHGPRFSNRMVGLSRLVALHDRLGDFPAAEHEQEILLARLPAHIDAENGRVVLDCEIKTLIRLYRNFQERVASLEVIGLEKKTLEDIASLSLLLRVIALDSKELYVAFLNSYASMFVTLGGGSTFLHLSASRGSLTFMTLLIKAGEEVDFLDHSGHSALHLAATEGHKDMVKVLLEYGADVNRQDEDDYSPLHFACAEGKTAIARVLLEYGADTQARTFGDGFSPLHLAIKSGQEDLVKLLLANGSKAMEKTAIGKTTLHLAAENGNKNFAELFLEKGIESDSADIYGIRPIHDAVNVGIAQLFLGRGADAHSPDKFSETPLLSAAWRDDVGVVELFLEHKANVNARDDQERTSLHRAVLMKRRQIVATLLKNGAEVNSQDCELKTPLHEAARLGEIKVVQLLLEHGARPQFLDAIGKSPLHYVTISRVEATSKPLQERLDDISSTLRSDSY